MTKKKDSTVAPGENTHLEVLDGGDPAATTTVRSMLPTELTDITGWRNGDMELYYHAGNSEWIVRSTLTDAVVRLGDGEMLSLAALMLAWGEES